MKNPKVKSKAQVMLIAIATVFVLSACTEDDENEESTVSNQELYNENKATIEKMEARKDAPTELAAEPVTQAEAKEVNIKDNVTLKGSIIYKELEGGFFAFITEKGDRFTLHGLDETYQKNGLVVEIEGITKPQMMTITQFGTVLEVQSVKVLDASNVIDGTNTH